MYTRDGRLVDDQHQSLAEGWYWHLLHEWGFADSPELIHAEEAEAFYSQDGELILLSQARSLEENLAASVVAQGFQ